MNQALPIRPSYLLFGGTFPLVRLLHPRQHTRVVVISLLAGFLLGALAVSLLNWPLWAATAIMLVVLLPAGILKWRADRRLFGFTAMVLSIVLTTQGLHTIEHLVQWIQYHVLFWTMRQSSGLLSPANAEWVHFVWNWLVLIAVLILMGGGMRNKWAWLLLAVTFFHTVEHSYTFIRYQLVLRELSAMYLLNITAQGLPGIVGRDGWLARSALTRGTFICTIPGLTTAIRLDIHFWWNTIEMTLLLIAGHVFLRSLPQFNAHRANAEHHTLVDR